MSLKASHPNDPERPISSGDGYVLDGSEFEKLLGRVHSSLDAERGLRGRLRALPTRVRALLVATAIALVVGSELIFSRRVVFDAYPLWRLAATAATYTGLLALVSSFALRPLYRSAVSAANETAVLVASFAAPFCWALAPSPTLAHVVASAGGGRDCLVVGIALGTVLIIVFRALDRAPQTNFRSAAVFAAAAGLLANLALACHCPRTLPRHLALVHAPIGLLLLLVYRRVLVRFDRRYAR